MLYKQNYFFFFLVAFFVDFFADFLVAFFAAFFFAMLIPPGVNLFLSSQLLLFRLFSLP